MGFACYDSRYEMLGPRCTAYVELTDTVSTIRQWRSLRPSPSSLGSPVRTSPGCQCDDGPPECDSRGTVQRTTPETSRETHTPPTDPKLDNANARANSNTFFCAYLRSCAAGLKRKLLSNFKSGKIDQKRNLG